MKNYLIIGGSSGVGNELVKILESKGNSIVATYNKNEVSNRENVLYFKLDVSEGNLSLENLPDEIHGLAYCPGAINLKPFTRFKEEDFIEDFKLQVLGATRIIQQVLPRLKASTNASVPLLQPIA